MVFAEIAATVLPPPAKAFPSGWHDALLKAAAHRDDEIALRDALTWLAANDVRAPSRRDRRLLLAVVDRHGERLRSAPAYPELAALQRMIWGGTRMALFEASPTLRKIAEAGLDLMLIKGAARLAADGDSMRARAADDIDIVVRPADAGAVLEILADDGWESNKGLSGQYLREHLPSIRSINLLKGRRGDIDLHTCPFLPGEGSEVRDDALWARSQPAKLNGVPVRIPSVEDRLALAIAHGGAEGHHRSDWLVDCAVLIARAEPSWPRFEEIVAERGLACPAFVTMSYIAEGLGHDVPPETLHRLAGDARRRPLRYLSGFLLARPCERASPAGRLAAGIAGHLRRRAQRRSLPPRRPDRRPQFSIRAGARDGASPGELRHRFDIPPGTGGRLRLRGALSIEAPAVRRRIELEVNGLRRHVCRISFRKLSARPKTLLVAFDGVFPIPEGETHLTLESRPTRQYPSDRPDMDATRRLPFCLISLDVERVDR